MKTENTNIFNEGTIKDVFLSASGSFVRLAVVISNTEKEVERMVTDTGNSLISPKLSFNYRSFSGLMRANYPIDEAPKTLSKITNHITMDYISELLKISGCSRLNELVGRKVFVSYGRDSLGQSIMTGWGFI